MVWHAIVDGELADRARATIAELVAALSAHPLDGDVDACADRAVVQAYLGDDEPAAAALAATVARVPPLRSAALYGGIARAGWTIAHLVTDDEADEACATIDANLERALAGWEGVYELISGLVGIGVYALERGPAGHALAGRVLELLEDTAQPRGDGVAWFTRPELLPPTQRPEAPEGYWNLGLAHGIPGVIAVLARFIAAGIEPTRCRALLAGALAYLGGVADPSEQPARYANWEPGGRAPTTRLAWCYGDFGVALALVGAGYHARDPVALADGLALARACAARSDAHGELLEAGLCHGTAGAAHLFARLANATGEAVFADCARAWLERTLDWQRAGHAIAGYPAIRTDAAGAIVEHADPTLLTGVAGVALALHAVTSDVEPAWDRLLLVDLPCERAMLRA